uniref:Ymf73 n=1 Tax=Tetrahymena malaccensis TaxID=5901 RepID=Q09F82_TETMA|nr:Ymf73 [Tetrahymena malaccensis]ABI51669.1 Ymf73 [Tetrahymena malaccensis]
MINKKLNLFLIENKKIIKTNTNLNSLNNNFNLIKYFKLTNYKEIKALISLLKCINCLNKLNKSIFIFNKNFITIIYKTNFFKKLITYKFNNIELMLTLKMFIYFNTRIFINTSENFIKFKSEYETYPEILFDCYHNHFSRKRVKNLSYKMFLLITYNLL